MLQPSQKLQLPHPPALVLRSLRIHLPSADPSIDLYFTGLGKKYHFRKDCYGLRNSQMVRHTDICEQCVPQLRGWHPRGRDMYGAGLNGPQHTDVTHCEKMHGYSIAYQPCNWCARPNESEK